MKKIVNVRIPVLAALFFAAGCGIGYIFFRYGVSLLYYIAVVPVAAIIIIVCVVKKATPALITSVLCSILIVCGGLYCELKLDSYSYSPLQSGAEYNISATVCEKGKTDYGEYLIVKNFSTDGMRREGKIMVYLSESYGEFCDIGYKVNFVSSLKHNNLYVDGELNYNIFDNVKYSCTVKSGLTARYGFDLFGVVRAKIRDTLFDNCDSEVAPVAFAMLTGNTQYIDGGLLKEFRYGGIAHIFAVSGLHIGILYGLLSFIFKKCRVNKYVRFFLCMLPIIFYSGVCGFTLSSVRALIMCGINSVAALFHKKYDGLNSLALAVIVILAINPVNLFNVGFQLSVSAVAGILTLKLPRKVPEFIKLPIAAQAATAPVMIAGFGYVSLISLALNIIAIPILSAIYVALFFGTILTMIMPFAAAVLRIILLPLQAMSSFIVIAGFENAILSLSLGAWTPFYYAGLVASSDKVNLKPLARLIILSVMFSAVCLCFIFL